MLFTSVAIGQSNYFGFGFTTLNWKLLYKVLQSSYSENTMRVSSIALQRASSIQEKAVGSLSVGSFASTSFGFCCKNICM